jgi:lactate racemase
VRTVLLPYGTKGLEVEIPESATVVEQTHLEPIADEAEAVTAALREPQSGPPLAEIVRGAGEAGRIIVVFPDLTRPMPNRTVLPPLLAELEDAGAGPDRVELICATGTHRQATADEMAALIGPEIVSKYRVHDHSATADDHVVVGRVDGTEIKIDRRYVEAEVRILTGFVEPHFFAGFSGGPKGVCPGLAAMETVLEAHSRARIADARATWTVMDGNPVQDFVRQAVELAPPSISVDVTIDRDRRLTGIFCGPLPGAHRLACRQVLETAVTTVDGPFEVVLTTNGGYPLDRNLYQAVKGMAAAEQVVAPGGTIVVAAECCDGLPSGGAFERLLTECPTPAELLAGGHSRGGNGGSWTPAEPDGWQAQVLGRVLSKARVWLKADGLDEASVRLAQMYPVDDIVRAIGDALGHHGRGSRLCVLVRGPLEVATNRSENPVGRPG